MAKHKKTAAKKAAAASRSKKAARKQTPVHAKPAPVKAAPVTLPTKKRTAKKTAVKKSSVKAPSVAPASKQSPQLPATILAIETKAAGKVIGDSIPRWRAAARTALFARLFMGGSAGVLLLTTLFWTVMTAKLHETNADQLIDAFLFESLQTFQGAIFPGTHSFLLKWPAFALMQLFGNSAGVFLWATVLMTCATVGALAFVLYRIERRPLVFGVICLALSSMLLLIPAQPYPGALLPVNLAMTTTRNLEYIVFIAALCFALRLRRLRSLAAVFVVLALAVVIASDKLFAVLALGGGLAVAVWYGLIRRQPGAIRPAVRWLLIAASGLAVSYIMLIALNRLGVTNIGNDTKASPFPLIGSAKQFVVGLLFGIGAFLTNFGANPAHAVTVLAEVPGSLLQGLKHWSAPAYAVNLALLITASYAAVKLLFSRGQRFAGFDQPRRLAVLLLGSTAAAGAVYVLTDHYYPVDARYLTIGFFAVSIAAAAYWRNRDIRPARLGIAAAVILAVLPLGAAMSWQQFQTDETAMAPRTDMNAKVTQELDRRKIDRLVGNYWDVTPPKSGTSRDLTISPVENCRTPRSVLNSQAWFGLPAKTPSAFLAVRDGSPLAGPDHIKPGSEVTYGGCSLARIVSTYGVPSERVSVGQPGDYSENPDALLLLYPGGLQPEDAPKAASLIPSMAPPAKPQAVQPPELQSLVPFTEKDVCTRGTMLQVIAHQDDDLLFMNPDLADAVKDGRCIRTVYLTAGDAGEQFVYWGGRERGAQAAYAQMYGVADEWSHEQQMLAGRKVTVSYLKDVSQVSLVFLRLPDGNLRGEGFMGHDFASLRSLLRGGIPELRSVDGVNSYTRADLVAALLEIMVRDLPGEIRTLGSGNGADGDHADHHDSGTLTDEAAAAYLQTHAIQHYVGYPVVGNPVNLPEDRITHKHDAFLAYAKHDGAVCQSVIECQQTITYGNYLTRQYPAVTQVTTAP